MAETSNARKRIGNSDIVATPEILGRVRSRCKELAHLGAKAKIAQAIKAEFPEFSERTLEDYAYCLLGVSDKVFDLYVGGSISIGVMSEIGHAQLNTQTKDFLAEKVVELKLTPSQIAVVKAEIKRKCSLAEAIMRATGEIPSHSRREDIGKSIKTFGSVVDDVNEAAMLFMVKFKQAADIIPVSTLDKGTAYMGLMEKVYVLETSLENALRFVAEKKKRFMKEIMNHVGTEAALDGARLKGDGHGDAAAGEGGPGVREEAEPPVQGQPGQ